MKYPTEYVQAAIRVVSTLTKQHNVSVTDILDLEKRYEEFEPPQSIQDYMKLRDQFIKRADPNKKVSDELLKYADMNITGKYVNGFIQFLILCPWFRSFVLLILLLINCYVLSLKSNS